MTAGTGSRLGVPGGMAGVLIGGFTWVVVYGTHVKLAANPAIGISRASLRLVQPILVSASLAGTALVLWDLLRRKP